MRAGKALGYRLLATGLVLGLLAVPPTTGAEEWLPEGTEAELLYVIKVTPTLVYLDGGTALVDEGETFLILRDGKQREMFVNIGEVKVIRRFDEFSIAEIVSEEEGAQIEVLDRALSEATWASLAASVFDEPTMGAETPETMTSQARKWSVHLVGGADLGKAIDLKSPAPAVAGDVEDVGGAGVGLRLARTFEKLRINATARLSGEPMGGDADVTHLAIELDGHLLFRGMGAGGLYIGAGASLHRLTWDAPAGAVDSAVKVGFQGVGGLEIPFGDSDWGMTLEGGYQGVVKWNGIVDASNVRAYVGIGKYF